MATLNNIAGCLLIDARAAFLNGAGIVKVEENKNKVIPKTFRQRIKDKFEETPYVSAQSWRRWLRDTVNEENGWIPSEMRVIKFNRKGNPSQAATEVNPIKFPEDDLFGYMKAGGSTDEEENEEGEKVKKGKEKKESIQRTSPFKTSILKGLYEKHWLTTDEAYVHLNEGQYSLPYSTDFYSTHLEGFFLLEYYRLGVYDNLGSHVELSTELLTIHKNRLNSSPLQIGGKEFKRYTLENADNVRGERAAGLLKGLALMRGGAKKAAFGADVSPKALILAGMECANPVFNDLFEGKGEKPELKVKCLQEIAADYASKLATPIYIGIRTGYLQNEDEVKALNGNEFVVDTPLGIVQKFNEAHLKV